MGNLAAAFTYTQYTGTNTVKLALYKDSDPNVEVAAQYLAGPFTNGIFSFTGLDSIAYRAKRFEVDNTDHTNVLADYGVFFVFIPNNRKIEYKPPTAWTAGVDLMPDGNVYPSGVNTFINADWVGWDIELFHYYDANFRRGRDYTYDSTAGALSKLPSDDIFEENAVYEIIWQPKITNGDVNSGGGSIGFAGKKYITANDSLTATDIGKLVIVKGTASYIEVSLPNLDDVPELKPMYIQMTAFGAVRCCKFKTFIAQGGQQKIDFAKGNITEICLYPTESFELFAEKDDSDAANIVSVWRIRNAQGNFLTVGEKVSDDVDASHVINKIELNGGGAGLDKNVYNRLYTYIQNLDPDQVVAYALWGNDTNRYKYSLADPSTGLFHIPDTRGQFERQSSAERRPNSFELDAMRDHEHATLTGELPSALNPFGTTPFPLTVGQYNATGTHKRDLTGTQYILATPGGWIPQPTSSETRPANVATNRWMRY